MESPAAGSFAMAFRKLARAEEVPPGKTKFVRAGATPVILANWNGRIYALYGLCPHQNNPLEDATMWDHLLDCPWHHFQYDVRTGENVFPKNVYPTDYPQLREQLRPLRTYPVQMKDGEIWVDLE
jgi:3-phenylpropionate/trans-cinnamate dioxygenase ferredoxin subunit